MYFLLKNVLAHRNIGANDKVFFFRFRHHKAMVAAAAATAPTSQNTSFASTESYPYESFDETGYGLVSSRLCNTFYRSYP